MNTDLALSDRWSTINGSRRNRLAWACLLSLGVHMGLFMHLRWDARALNTSPSVDARPLPHTLVITAHIVTAPPEPPPTAPPLQTSRTEDGPLRMTPPPVLSEVASVRHHDRRPQSQRKASPSASAAPIMSAQPSATTEATASPPAHSPPHTEAPPNPPAHAATSSTSSPSTSPHTPLNLELPAARAGARPLSGLGYAPSVGPREPQKRDYAHLGRTPPSQAQGQDAPTKWAENRHPQGDFQAEVTTPLGRYCLRARTHSRMSELRDSASFDRAIQPTNCL